MKEKEKTIDVEKDEGTSGTSNRQQKKQVLFSNRLVMMDTVPPRHPPGEEAVEDGEYCSSVDSAEADFSQVGLAKAAISSSSTIWNSSKKHFSCGLALSKLQQRISTNYNYGYDDKNSMPFDYSAARRAQLQRCWNTCCWIFIALLSVSIIVLLAMVLTWIIVRPRRPSLLVRSIQVQSLTMGSLADPMREPPVEQVATYLSNITLDVQVRNPNRVVTNYSLLRFSISYQNEVVGTGEMSVSSFSQAAHATKQDTVKFTINKVHVQSKAIMWRKLLNDIHNKDSVSLQVDGSMQARLQILGLSTPPIKIKVWCSTEIKVSQQKISNQQCRRS